MTFIPGGSGGGAGRINTSSDVAIDAINEGDVLVYNSDLQLWKNSQVIDNVSVSVESLLDRIAQLERQVAGTTPIPVASPGITSVSVSWEPIFNATEYWLYNGATKVDETSAASYTFSGLTANTAYVLGVRSIATDGTQSPIGTVSVTTDTAAPTETVSIMWSTSADRSNPLPLSGATLITTNDYIFTYPDLANIQSVSFVTDGATGSPYTESTAPFDYKGSMTTAPFTANPNALSAGAHTIAVIVTYNDSTPTQNLNASFTVAGAPTITTASLRWSTAADRSNPLILSGATSITTNDYVFVTANDLTKVASVAFSIDGNAVTPTDTISPFDLRGNSGANANPLNLAGGAHTITAVVTFNDGTAVQNLSASFNVYDPGTGGGGSTSDSSYWQSNAQYAVTGGWQLDPSARKWAGNRPGVSLTNWTGGSDIGAGTYRNYMFNSMISVSSSNAKFINCRFKSSNFNYPSDIGKTYACGTSTSAVNFSSVTPTFIDCEFYGGQGATFTGAGTLIRCLLMEGSDVVNLRPPFINMIECVIDGAKRASSSSHADAIQSTTNSGSTTVHNLTVTRCWINVYNRRNNDHHNTCLQLGGYGSGSSGLTGTANYSYFQGGNTTINMSASGGAGMTYRNCRISRKWRGLNSKGDEGGPGFSSTTTDTRIRHASNVWAENPDTPVITTMLSRLNP